MCVKSAVASCPHKYTLSDVSTAMEFHWVLEPVKNLDHVTAPEEVSFATNALPPDV